MTPLKMIHDPPAKQKKSRIFSLSIEGKLTKQNATIIKAIYLDLKEKSVS